MRDVEERAEAVLAPLPTYVWDGDTLPVPVEDIADTQFGLLVRDVEDMASAPGAPLVEHHALSGLLLPARGEIWVNAHEAKQWPPRRRFTIGHELGHWVMHRDRPAGAVLPGQRGGGQGARHRGGGERVRRGAADAAVAVRARARPREGRRGHAVPHVRELDRRHPTPDREPVLPHGSHPSHPAAGAARDERARRRGQERHRARGRRGRAAADQQRVAADNTPDILTEYLQHGGRPAFLIRLVLAATLGASYGIYGPAFELCEHRPRFEGSEEYLDSEKYEIRSWDLEQRHSLQEFIARVNRIRRENPALQSNQGLHFHTVDNPELLCYSKSTADRSNVVLVVVNLSPYHVHSGWVELQFDTLGLDPTQPAQMHDELSDARYIWHGARHYVELHPQVVPAHIFRLRRRIRTEQDFEYYL